MRELLPRGFAVFSFGPREAAGWTAADCGRVHSGLAGAGLCSKNGRGALLKSVIDSSGLARLGDRDCRHREGYDEIDTI